MVGPRVVCDAEIGEDEPAQNLDDALFGGVSGGTETAAQVAVEAVLGPTGVPTLMEMDSVCRCGVPELRESVARLLAERGALPAKI